MSSGFAHWREELDAILVRDYRVSTVNLGIGHAELQSVVHLSLPEAARTLAGRLNLHCHVPSSRVRM